MNPKNVDCMKLTINVARQYAFTLLWDIWKAADYDPALIKF